MNILGFLLVVTGAGLFFAGGLTNKSLPPDYNADSDDGFFELLTGVAKVLKTAGCIFIIVGLICFVIFICTVYI